VSENYATLAELRAWVGVDDSLDDALLARALTAAELRVEEWCGRKFTQNVASPLTSVRVHPQSSGWLYLPPFRPGGTSTADISTLTGLVVKTDDNDDGTAETTWTITTDFEVEPFDGPPFHKIVAVGSRWFPCLRRPSVQITARWGWASVPEPVHTATLILAGEFAKLKDAPFGVAGFGEFGVVRIRQNPKVAELLSRFQHPMTAAVTV